jgi:hypothetical protein
MTTAQTQALPTSDVALAAGACAVCPHPLAAHDTISLRFCRATEAQASTTRGCVCPAK